MPRQTTAPSDYPQAVLQQIQRLGQHIAIARQRRGESQAQWAHKLGISQPTMARMERGDPSVAMASYAMCIWLINPAAGVAELIAPARDHAEFHEQCVERIFQDVSARCAPRALSVEARYTRRGGLDINPWRATPGFAAPLARREIRQ